MPAEAGDARDPDDVPRPRAIIPGRTASIVLRHAQHVHLEHRRGARRGRGRAPASAAPTPAQATRTSVGPTSASIAATAALQRRPRRSRRPPTRRRVAPAVRVARATSSRRSGVAVDQPEPVAPRGQGHRPSPGRSRWRRRCRTIDLLIGRRSSRRPRPASSDSRNVRDARRRTPRGSPRGPGAWRRGRAPRRQFGRCSTR